MKPLLRISLLALTGLLAGAPFGSAADTSAATVESPAAAELRLERKLLPVDLADYGDARKREGEARDQLRAAAEHLDQALTGDAVSLGTLETLHGQLAATQGSVHLAEVRLERVLARLEDRLRRISFLEGETGATSGATVTPTSRSVSPQDSIAGTWRMRIEPKGETARLELTRDGALVTGQMVLPGGASFGVRGTYSNNGLRLERLNARGETEATYLGTLEPANGRLSGEWQESSLVTGKPVTGSFTAERISNGAKS